MVSGAHEDASSSRNVNRIISVSRGAGGRCLVHLESGSSFFVTLELTQSLGLIAGHEVTDLVVGELEFADGVQKATDKAIKLISMRDHSVTQLKNKLQTRGFSVDVINATCQSCLDHGYLDDLRFAKLWLESRIGKRNEGILRLKAGLAKTGVSRDIADVALSEILSDEYEEEAFQREIASLESRGKVTVARIIRRLSSLGFPASKIQSYVENRDEIDAGW